MKRALGLRLDLREDLWKIVVVLAGLALLNGAFYLFLNLPRTSALSRLEASGNEAARSLRVLTKRCDEMEQLVRRYDDETVHLEDFYVRKVATQAERMTTIQKEIRSIATEFHIDPSSIDYVSEDKDPTGLVRFQISIPLVGGYPNLRQFIHRIEASPHLLAVDSVELTGAREGGAMLSLTIRISTWFQAPQNAPEGAGA